MAMMGLFEWLSTATRSNAVWENQESGSSVCTPPPQKWTPRVKLQGAARVLRSHQPILEVVYIVAVPYRKYNTATTKIGMCDLRTVVVPWSPFLDGPFWVVVYVLSSRKDMFLICGSRGCFEVALEVYLCRELCRLRACLWGGLKLRLQSSCVESFAVYVPARAVFMSVLGFLRNYNTLDDAFRIL